MNNATCDCGLTRSWRSSSSELWIGWKRKLQPERKRNVKKKIYERGDYYLAFDTNWKRIPRSKNLYIFYDREAGRSRRHSTGTSNLKLAKEELDRFYEEREKSHKFCPTCGQAFSGELPPLVATAIAEYLESTDYETATPRLDNVLAYVNVAIGVKSVKPDFELFALGDEIEAVGWPDSDACALALNDAILGKSKSDG